MSMVSTVLKNLVSRPATLRYPSVPAKIPDSERGRIVYDMKKCIFCGLCERRCPTNAIKMDKGNKRQMVSRAKCIACGVCVESCPTDAISMRPEYSSPATSPEIHVYDAKLTTHQFTVLSLPTFERAKPEGPEVRAQVQPEPTTPKPPPEEVKRLGLDSLARDVMTKKVLTLFEDDSVRKAVQIMVTSQIDGLPIVDINMKVLGIVTGKDIARDAGRGKEGVLTFLFPRNGKRSDRVQEDRLRKTMDKPVYEIMTSPAITATEDTPLRDIVSLMDKHRFNRVPVVDANGRVCGIITRADILRVIALSGVC